LTVLIRIEVIDCEIGVGVTGVSYHLKQPIGLLEYCHYFSIYVMLSLLDASKPNIDGSEFIWPDNDRSEFIWPDGSGFGGLNPDRDGPGLFKPDKDGSGSCVFEYLFALF
jgi:hypothetical protein